VIFQLFTPWEQKANFPIPQDNTWMVVFRIKAAKVQGPRWEGEVIIEMVTRLFERSRFSQNNVGFALFPLAILPFDLASNLVFLPLTALIYSNQGGNG
jgi:hypothetical protein